MKGLRIGFLAIVVQTVLSACSVDEVDFQLVEFTTNDDHPAIRMRATNTGDVSVYEVFCNAYASRDNIVLDTAFLYFANGARIREGDAVEDLGTWNGLSSHDQYEVATWECDYETSR